MGEMLRLSSVILGTIYAFLGYSVLGSMLVESGVIHWLALLFITPLVVFGILTLDILLIAGWVVE